MTKKQDLWRDKRTVAEGYNFCLPTVIVNAAKSGTTRHLKGTVSPHEMELAYEYM